MRTSASADLTALTPRAYLDSSGSHGCQVAKAAQIVVPGLPVCADVEEERVDPVNTNNLPRIALHGEGVPDVRWQGAFVSYGGHGADASTVIVFEIEPGGRLGWHTDQTEETQYIIAGTGELQRDDGNFPVGPGSVFVLPTDVRHDLVNTGNETMRAVAFFSAAMFTQKFDELMQPVNTHVLGTPNREGYGRV